MDDGSYRKFATRTILCAVSLHEASGVVGFAAELAAQHNARLILQHVIRPQERPRFWPAASLDEIEKDLMMLVPHKLQQKIAIQTIVVPGDPTEELLYQSKAQQADLIVLGAQGASAFAAITRHGVVYKVLAHAHCPVITLSPVVLAECGSKSEKLSRPKRTWRVFSRPINQRVDLSIREVHPGLISSSSGINSLHSHPPRIFFRLLMALAD